MNIKVVIADDHPLIISGLQNMLRPYPEIEIIDTYENGTSLMAGLAERLPDVLLLDIQMPDVTGIELTPVLKKKYPDLHIIALTIQENNYYVTTMLRHDASGYLLKNVKPDILAEAIHAVYSGDQYIDASLKDRVWKAMLKQKKQTEITPEVSNREREILQLIAYELTSKEIADRLCVSIRTVETHRLNLLLKLGMKNTAGLVRYAVQMGLID